MADLTREEIEERSQAAAEIFEVTGQQSCIIELKVAREAIGKVIGSTSERGSLNWTPNPNWSGEPLTIAAVPLATTIATPSPNAEPLPQRCEQRLGGRLGAGRGLPSTVRRPTTRPTGRIDG